jgi:hypothetical protein
MPTSYKVVQWTNDHEKLFKNASKKGNSAQFSDQLNEIATLLDNEYTFQFDKSSSYSSLFTITQPSSPTSTASSPTILSNTLTQLYNVPLQSSSDSAVIQSSLQEKKKRLKATLLFLDLWRYLLSVVDHVPYNERKLIFKIIVHLMKRREFYVSHFKSSNMYPDIHQSSRKLTTDSSETLSTSQLLGKGLMSNKSPSPKDSPSSLSALSGLFNVFGSSNTESTIDKLENQVLTQFLELSYKTHDYVVRSVLSAKQHNVIYEELFQFCAQVLAINCFRLYSPNDTESFVQQLCIKSLTSNFVSQESLDIIRRNIDGDETRKLSLTYSASTESFRALLKQNIQPIMNKSIGSSSGSENEESKQIVNRLFRFYRLFFTNELQSSKRVLKDEEKKNLIWSVKSAHTYLPKFGSSHLFFFTFFSEFVRQIARLMSTETVDYWQYAPGYRCLLNHYVEIALQNVKNYMKKDLYPEPTSNYAKSISNWIGCSNVAIKNPVFLNILMEIFFKHTNAYHLDQVFFTLIWLENWFKELSIIQHSFQLFLLNNHRLRDRYFHIPDSSDKHLVEIFIGELPPNFHYDFFEQAIDALLATHHFQIITRTLIFLYEVLDLFNGKERLKLIYEFLQKKHFFTLFLHWSEDARACFHRILTYKVQRYCKSDLTHYSAMLEAKTHKKEAKETMENPQQTDNIVRHRALTVHHSHDLRDCLNLADPIERPRRTSVSGSRPTLEDVTGHDSRHHHHHHHHHHDGRHSLDLPSDHRPMSEEISTPSTKSTSLFSRIGLKNKDQKAEKPKKKVSQNTLLDEHLSTEFQRTEEAIDLVLMSKTDSYISILQSYAENGTSHPADESFFISNDLQVPPELIPYIPKALKQYEAIKKESIAWRHNTTLYLLEREKKMAQAGRFVDLRIIPYPKISFPKFVLKADNAI